jgi:hypothetical protein
VDPDAKPNTVFERSKLRATVVEDQRGCGHTGYMIELEFLYGPGEDLFRFGLVPDLVLADTIMLLQTAQEFVAKANGLHPLPTIRLDGATYYVDRRLGEFRNVDNPHDRIAMNPSA